MNKNRLIRVFVTEKNSKHRLTELKELYFKDFSSDYSSRISTIIIDDNKTFQKIEGFGAAFTEAAAVTFYKLSPEKRTEILNAYFSKNIGNHYTLCRTHINSCDFSLGNYAYTEVEGDVELNHFSISRDRRALIPLIKEAQKIAGNRLKLLASPWSPPAWMKTTGKMNGGGKLKSRYRDAWATYYCRYIEEYKREGISIWGLTVQNEPAASQIWESCVYSAEEERDFVRDYLGPALKKGGYSYINLLIWDHNRDMIYERAKTVYDDSEASKYIWGTGFHWYGGENFDNIQLVHDAFPDKKLLFTEGSQENGPHIGEWALGERYAHSIINDLNRWTVGWIDWNMILNIKGGPNHAANYCSAPIIADTVRDELLFQSSYYYIGHFSRFIKTGAVRVVCSTSKDELEATAFINRDGKIAVVVLNRSDKLIPFILKYKVFSAGYEIAPHSIITLYF